MSMEQELENIGVIVSGALVADGNIHRLPTQNKPSGKNGWYLLFEDGNAGFIGNWEQSDKALFWYADGTRKEDYRERRQEAEKKLEVARNNASIKAANELEKLNDTGHSDYLARKKIGAHGLKFGSNYIAIPIRDATGKVWSYQRIYNDGTKYFMAGGRIRGCYHLLAKKAVKDTDLVVIAEGYATACTIHEQTGLPVAVAFFAGNLKAVCDSLPFANLLVAADNDKSKAGEKAAIETGRRYVMPETEGFDFSDLYLVDKPIKHYFDFKQEEAAIEAHGLVADIANWITSTAIRPQLILSLAAAITFVGLLKGHRVQSVDRSARTNILCLALAPTGAGKEHPQQCIFKLIKECGLQKHLMGEPVSGVGLLNGLLEAGRIGMLAIDEMGRYFSNATGANAGGFQREIVDYMIKSFTKANGILIGRAYGNTKKNPRIDVVEPHLCVMGATVREKITAACSGSDIIDGFLNRWLIFEVEKRSSPVKGNRLEAIPVGIMERIAKVMENQCEYNHDMTSNPIEVEYTPEALDLLAKYHEWIEHKMQTSGYPLVNIYVRCNEHIAKLALLVSDDDCITRRDVLFAINVVKHSLKSMQRFLGDIAENQHEIDFNKVKDVINKSRIINKAELTRRTQFVLGGNRRREEIITALLDTGFMIETDEAKNLRGRPSVVYKIVR